MATKKDKDEGSSGGSSTTGPTAAERISPADTEALAEAGRSAADLELRLPSSPTGPSRIKKSSPEMPSLEQIEAATAEQSTTPEVTVTVTDAAGETIEQRIRPDDAAAITQRTASQQATHPAHRSKGYWSNPNLTEMSDEEKAQDSKNYAGRVG